MVDRFGFQCLRLTTKQTSIYFSEYTSEGKQTDKKRREKKANIAADSSHHFKEDFILFFF